MSNPDDVIEQLVDYLAPSFVLQMRDTLAKTPKVEVGNFRNGVWFVAAWVENNYNDRVVLDILGVETPTNTFWRDIDPKGNEWQLLLQAYMACTFAVDIHPDEAVRRLFAKCRPLEEVDFENRSRSTTP